MPWPKKLLLTFFITGIFLCSHIVPASAQGTATTPAYLITNKIIAITLDGQVDLRKALTAKNWLIKSSTDKKFAKGLRPQKIYRFTNVLDADDQNHNGQNQADVILRHTIYLVLPTALLNGQTYTISNSTPLGTPYFYDGVKAYALTKTAFGPWTITPGTSVSGAARAIKINQLGYSVKSKQRYAYVGYWLGNGGALALPPVIKYTVFDANTAKPVLSGTSTNRGKNKLSGEIVHELNLSKLPEGKYYLEAAGIGRSWIFQVGGSSAFEAFYTTIRGLYHERAGTKLEALFTPWTHNLCHNTIYLNDSQENFGDKFPKDTPQTNPITLSGGWYDAGDFDRRPMHLQIVEDLLMLQESFPQLGDNLTHIPESGNGLPDVLDEALYGLNFWGQLQTADGGIRAGAESYAHPGQSGCEGDTLPYWTYAPNRWTSYKFSAVAAQTARLLKSYNTDNSNKLSAYWLDKAQSAWRWAESQTSYGTTAPVPRDETGKKIEISRERFSAAGALFAATNDTVYQDIYKKLWPENKNDTWWINEYSLWNYANSTASTTDNTFRNEVIQRIYSLADEQTDLLKKNIYRTLVNPAYPIAWGSGTNALRNVVPQIIAYHFKPEQKYIDIVSLSADFQLGAHPSGLSWVTGLGIVTPEFPLHLNSMYDNIKNPVPGLPVYGPQPRDYNNNCTPRDYWPCLVYNNFYPAAANIPPLYSYAPWARMADMNEFTVWQDMNYMSLAYGFLYAVSGAKPIDLKNLTPKNYPLNASTKY